MGGDPGFAPGPVPVSVVNPDGQRGTLANGFIYQGAPPAISTVNPNIGPLTGGTTITLTGTNFSPNATVDIASGTLLHHVGLRKPEYYTTFFGWARVAGIGAQIVDERTVMRDGKGVPIYRPKYIAEEQSLRHV